MRIATIKTLTIGTLAALLGGACAEESLVLPGAGTPSAVVAVGGDNQAARVGEMLPSPLVVEVRDVDGNAVPGMAVRWTAEGGGSLSATEGTTNASGQAAVQWRLGGEAGVQRAIAMLGIDDGLRETFTASAVPEGSPRLSIATEPPEGATSGEALDRAPVVQLTADDGSDLQNEGVSVTVAIVSGGGELAGERTRETDSDGRASFPGLVLSGSEGTRRLIFAADGYTSVTSRSVELRQAPPPPSPGSIELERGDGQTANTGTAVSVDPAVQVLDASGKPKSGVTVTFSVASGGGSVSGATAVSDGAGVATVGEWRLGGTPGTNTLRASASGYEGSPVTFTATAVAPPPPPPPPPAARALVFSEQPRDTEEQETMQTVRVRIVDEDGKTVTSASNVVKLELVREKGSGSLSGTTEQAAVNGVASFSNLRVNREGDYRLRAVSAGLESATSSKFDVEDD